MASAGAPEGSIPNTAATGPGTQNVSGSSGAMSIVDAGLCSKISTQLPQLLTFFNSTKNALSGITSRNKTNSSAISNLQRSQTDFNNQTNFFSFWLRQFSPQVDAAGVGLNQANSALVEMAEESSEETARPGMPSALAVLPGPNIGQVTVYFMAPSYTGNSPISKYDIMQEGSFVTPVKTTAISHPAVATTFGPTEFHDMYKGMPVNAWVLSSGASLQIRAVNTSGVNNAELPGDWTAPTRLVTVATGSIPPIVITNVLPGREFNLISWKNPHVPQADKTNLSFTGINRWTFTVKPSAAAAEVDTDLTVVEVGAAASIAQIQNVFTVNSPSTAYKIKYTTLDAVTPTTEYKSAATTFYGRAWANDVMPPPRITASTDSNPTGQHFLRIGYSLANFFTPQHITYQATATDVTNASLFAPLIPSVQSAAYGINNVNALGYRADSVIDVTFFQGRSYIIKAKSNDGLASADFSNDIIVKIGGASVAPTGPGVNFRFFAGKPTDPAITETASFGYDGTSKYAVFYEGTRKFAWSGIAIPGPVTISLHIASTGVSVASSNWSFVENDAGTDGGIAVKSVVVTMGSTLTTGDYFIVFGNSSNIGNVADRHQSLPFTHTKV